MLRDGACNAYNYSSENLHKHALCASDATHGRLAHGLVASEELHTRAFAVIGLSIYLYKTEE